MSYECDWCYALGLELESTPTTLDLLLASIRSGRYNLIVVNFYANHSNLDKVLWYGLFCLTSARLLLARGMVGEARALLQ
jgi:hypothetical protein